MFLFCITNFQISQKQQMEGQKNPQGQQNKQSQKRYEYQVCQVQSAGCINKWGMYLSQPLKYFGTHVLLHLGLGLHYYATFGYLHLSLGIINIILHIICTLVLITLAFTDPGMIPKINPNYEKMQLRKIPTNYQRYSSLLKYYQKQFWTPIKGHNLKLKFCNTCFIYRSPRTVHCDQCGICIQKFDHHCPWIGTCVAKRNYKFFLFFIGALSILTTKIWIQTIVVTVLHTQFSQGADIAAKSVINIFLCIYIFPAMGFSDFMFVLHLKLAARNVTTNQFCKQTWDNLSGNPFKKQSGFKNLLKIISLHYQGKVNKFQSAIYDRNKLAAQNQSIVQLHDGQKDKTSDNIDDINQSHSKSHKNYSTNDRHHGEQQTHERTQKISRQGKRPQANKKAIYKDLVRQNPSQTRNQPTSIFDINIRLNKNPSASEKTDEPQQKQKQQAGPLQLRLQKQTMPQISQMDHKNQGQGQLQRSCQHKLKVVVEENKQKSSKKSPVNVASQHKQLQKQQQNYASNYEMSIMRIDPSQRQHVTFSQNFVISQNQIPNNIQVPSNFKVNSLTLKQMEEKYLKPHYLKKIKSQNMLQPKFLQQGNQQIKAITTTN